MTEETQRSPQSIGLQAPVSRGLGAAWIAACFATDMREAAAHRSHTGPGPARPVAPGGQLNP